ncbi:MAG: Crp/Fnr family transcriptional regulator [Gammaproteobacteria bacterium]
MTPEEVLAAVSGSKLALELAPRDIADLATIMEGRLLEDGEVLMREGEVDDRLYCITSGRLAVEKSSPSTQEAITLHILSTGDLAGELAIVDGNEHTATLRAIGPTQVVSLARDALEGLLDTHPQVVYYVMRAIVRSGHSIVRRMNLQYVELSNYLTGDPGEA